MHMYNRQCYARIIDYEIEPVCVFVVVLFVYLFGVCFRLL